MVAGSGRANFSPSYCMSKNSCPNLDSNYIIRPRLLGHTVMKTFNYQILYRNFPLKIQLFPHSAWVSIILLLQVWMEENNEAKETYLQFLLQNILLWIWIHHRIQILISIFFSLFSFLKMILFLVLHLLNIHECQPLCVIHPKTVFTTSYRREKLSIINETMILCKKLEHSGKKRQIQPSPKKVPYARGPCGNIASKWRPTYRESNENRVPMALTDKMYPDTSNLKNHVRMPIRLSNYFLGGGVQAIISLINFS